MRIASRYRSKRISPAAFERYLDAMRTVTAPCRTTGAYFSYYKMYEPALLLDGGRRLGYELLLRARAGAGAFSLVDLGHHGPSTNIEQIVARLIQFGKLGGFHFNDSKFGDDDLDAGS